MTTYGAAPFIYNLVKYIFQFETCGKLNTFSSAFHAYNTLHMNIPSVRFSTSGLTKSQAHELANVVTSNVCGTEYKDNICKMAIESWNLGALLINPVRSTAEYIWRTKRMAAASGIDHFRLRLCKDTGISLRTGYKEIKTVPGDITIVDLGRDFETYGSDGEMIFIYIPRDILYQHLPQNLRMHLHGLHIKNSTVLGSMLAAHILRLRTLLPRMMTRDVPYICDSTLKLITNTIACTAENADMISKNYPDVLATQIKEYIIINLANTDLTLQTIMKHFNISRTSLHQLFVPYHGVSNYIRTLRLRRILQLLVDPANINRSIGEIAFSFGFNNESHFSRVFRNFFGISPTEARKSIMQTSNTTSIARNTSSTNLHDVVSTIKCWQFNPVIDVFSGNKGS